MRHLITLACLAAVALCSAVAASANNRLVVYIECSNPKQPELPLFKGTGVVISSEGHVLTAEHVQPEGYECVGSLENNTIAKRQLQVDFKDFQLNEKIDGKLLRFIPSSGETFDYATYCPVNADSVGDVIVVKGFHGKSKGLPSATLGILSTYIANPRGILETDAQTVGGKSGGPVFLQNTDTIIGIVAGAEFDPSGLPAYYGVLTAEALLQFGVLQKSQSCGGTAKEQLAQPAVTEPAEAEAPQTIALAAPAAPEVKPSVADPNMSPADIEAALAMSKSDKVLLQQSLTALGFNTAGFDGIWGPKTRNAISRWQISRGQEATGFVDGEQTKVIISTAANALEKQKEEAKIAAAVAAAKPAASGGNTAQAEDYYSRAYVLFDKQQFRQAIDLLDKAIAIDPDNALYWSERGLNHYELGQLNNALSDLNKSLSIRPNDAEALATRGWTYMELVVTDRAYADFKKAEAIAPGGTDAADGLAELCEYDGKC